MVEKAKSSPMVEEDRFRKGEENCDDNIRVSSIEAANPKADILISKASRTVLKGALISTDGASESVSAFTGTKASDSNNVSGSNNSSCGTGIASEQSSGAGGPPSNIIQKYDDESAQLIILDSMPDSDASDLNGIITKGDNNKTSWLNIDSSSTSQGSQGSYAHQVPALLGSYGSNGVGDQPNEGLLSPTPKTAYTTKHSRSSHFLNLEAPHNSTLDEILGKNGEPIQFSLDSYEDPVKSDLDNILGPESDGKPSDLDDTLGPYEGSTAGPLSAAPSAQASITRSNKQKGGSTSIGDITSHISKTSSSSHDNQAGRRTLKMLEDTSIRQGRITPAVLDDEVPQNSSSSAKQNPKVQIQSTSTMQRLHLQPESNSFSVSKSTWESKETDRTDVSKRSLNSIWESSHGDTFDDTQVDETLGEDSRLSTWDTNYDETLSPNSYSQRTGHTLSSDFRSDSYTFSSSQRDALSQRYDSLMTNSSGIDLGDSRNPINLFSTEGSSLNRPTKNSELNHTEHTSDTQLSSITASKGTDSKSRTNVISRGESSLASPTKHSHFSHTERTGTTTNARCSTSDSVVFDGTRGGRMFLEAQLQADSSTDRPQSPRAKKFAESIMARTRSRADPDALLGDSSKGEGMEMGSRSMIKMNNQEEGRFIESAAIARKRGRVVQLLTIGLLSFLIAFLGGFLVLSSCHFVSAFIQVGEDSEDLKFHFGLWKYSPADSVSQGYTYCSGYDGDFAGDAPWFGRILSLLSLLFGAFSLGVLWLYLVLGRCIRNLWNNAIYAAAFSGVLQLSTLSILTSRICNEQVCTLGPAGNISVVAGCFYFVLAFEMYYNTPLFNPSDSLKHVSSREDPDPMMGNLEMTDFKYGAKAFFYRMWFGGVNLYPTSDMARVGIQKHVNKIRRDRENPSYMPPSNIV